MQTVGGYGVPMTLSDFSTIAVHKYHFLIYVSD